MMHEGKQIELIYLETQTSSTCLNFIHDKVSKTDSMSSYVIESNAGTHLQTCHMICIHIPTLTLLTLKNIIGFRALTS